MVTQLISEAFAFIDPHGCLLKADAVNKVMRDLLGEELEDVCWELPSGKFRVRYRLGADNDRELQRDSDTTMAGILVELKRAFHTKPRFSQLQPVLQERHRLVQVALDRPRRSSRTSAPEMKWRLRQVRQRVRAL